MTTEIKLTHLGQLHRCPFDSRVTPEVIELVATSQIKVANYIKAHPKALIFLEGLTESYTGIPGDRLTSVVKIIFPSGVPASVGALNQLQKKILTRTRCC